MSMVFYCHWEVYKEEPTVSRQLIFQLAGIRKVKIPWPFHSPPDPLGGFKRKNNIILIRQFIQWGILEEECEKKKKQKTKKKTEFTGEEKKEKNGTYHKGYSSSCTKHAYSYDFWYIHLAEQPMLDSFYCHLYILLLRKKKRTNWN